MADILKIASQPRSNDLLSCLLFSRIQAHVFHVQAYPSKYFAAHSALGTFYEEIEELWDTLIEQLQGKNKKIYKGYKSYELKDFKSVEDTCNYFIDLNKEIELKRNIYEGSEIQNTFDEIVSLVNSTIYKLNSY